MIYLNEPEEGGATRFKIIRKTIQPETGKLLTWNNLLSDGRPNPATLHQGMKVRRGTKYLLTKWFRHQRALNRALASAHRSCRCGSRFLKGDFGGDFGDRLPHGVDRLQRGKVTSRDLSVERELLGRALQRRPQLEQLVSKTRRAFGVVPSTTKPLLVK